VTPGTTTRRRLVWGATALWALGAVGMVAMPPSGASGGSTSLVADARLRTWLDEVLARDPALAPGVRLVEPGAASADAAWLGLVDGPPPPGQVETTIALRRHVVVVWEASRERLGLLDPASPVDWRRLHDRLVAEAEARFVLPLPAAPLGADGLGLLALGYAGATSLPDAAGDDPALRAWLAPFYQRQLRPRSDETIQFEDWARYRTTLGDAGLLPEPEALQLQVVLGRQARLHLRYPPLDLPRGYALRLPARPSPAQERLRTALTGAAAQRLLAEHGFRPGAATPAPAQGPFVDAREVGARWEAPLQPVTRTPALERLTRSYRP
jgi:hypothetical protein